MNWARVYKVCTWSKLTLKASHLYGERPFLLDEDMKTKQLSIKESGCISTETVIEGWELL